MKKSSSPNQVIRSGRKKNTWGKLSPAKITQLRRALQLSQRALAKALGCTVNVVGEWERGKFAPGPEFAKKLAALIAGQPTP